MENGKVGRWTRRGLLGAGIAAALAGTAGLGTLWLREGGALVRGVARARPVTTDTAVPDQVDVVVIGGGNIGCLTALTLAERGVRVALCEKGVIAGEASGRSLGYIDSQFLDPEKLPLVARSKELWHGLTERVGAEIGYRPSGIVFFCRSKEALGAAEQWVSATHGMPGADGKILSASEAMALAGPSADQYAGAMLQPSDATAEPQLVAPAVADAIRRAGGIVLQGCAVRGLETAAGRVAGVVTERGRIGCQSVVLAGGVWTPLFARSLGLDVPQFMAFSQVMRVTPNSGPELASISDRGFVLRPTINGACDACAAVATVPLTPLLLGHVRQLWPVMKQMGDFAGEVQPALNLSTFMEEWRIPAQWRLDEASPFEKRRILMPETRTSVLDRVIADARKAYPAFSQSKVLEQWAGALTSTLDNMPVLSGVDRHPGLYLGTGFYYGLTKAPAAGEALADLVMGRAPQFDLKPYRYTRFSDGTPLRFHA